VSDDFPKVFKEQESPLTVVTFESNSISIFARWRKA